VNGLPLKREPHEIRLNVSEDRRDIALCKKQSLMKKETMKLKKKKTKVTHSITRLLFHSDVKATSNEEPSARGKEKGDTILCKIQGRNKKNMSMAASLY
jgi:hypothetical protein